jgi:coenzyme F420 hydrogenase subunit beta
MNEIGPYQKIMMARANDKEIKESAQYGGVVSALLIYGLEKQLVKSAVVTDAGGSRSPAGKTVKTRSEVLNCAGSRYSASASLSALNRALKAGEDKLAVVGLPCQMEALARMRLMKPHEEAMGSSSIVLRIGIFCTWALDYRLLEAFLKTKGVKGLVKKYDIPPPPSEKFRVETEMGWKDFALPDVRALVQKGCSLCLDMTAEQADISIGNAEGLEGWNTIVVRTDIGAKLMNEATQEGWLETGGLPEGNLEHLKEAAHNKRQRGNKTRIDSAVSQK